MVHPTNRKCVIILLYVDIAPTYPIYNRGYNPLTIRGMNHQVLTWYSILLWKNTHSALDHHKLLCSTSNPLNLQNTIVSLVFYTSMDHPMDSPHQKTAEHPLRHGHRLPGATPWSPSMRSWPSSRSQPEPAGGHPVLKPTNKKNMGNLAKERDSEDGCSKKNWLWTCLWVSYAFLWCFLWCFMEPHQEFWRTGIFTKSNGPTKLTV